MWLYEIATHTLTSPLGRIFTQGYSGHGPGRNNPALQTVRNVGPIPVGMWAIVALVMGRTKHGPYVLQLAPMPGTDTFYRSGFLVHGDSLEHPGEASEGCLIQPRPVRELIWNSGDRHIEVFATLPLHPLAVVYA